MNTRHIICAVAAAALVACGGAQKDTEETFTAPYVTIELCDSTELCDYHCSYEVQVSFVNDGNAAARLINDTLAAFYFGQPGAEPEEALQLWRAERDKEYTDAAQEMMDEGVEYPGAYGWMYEVEGAELAAPQGIRTFSGMFGLYQGGAHGYSAIYYKHFDAATGRKLGYEEVLGLTPRQALPIVQRCFEAEQGQSLDELAGMGYWEAKDWPEPDNYYMNHSGDTVTFVYNPYDVACYAVGKVAIAVPRAMLCAK